MTFRPASATRSCALPAPFSTTARPRRRAITGRWDGAPIWLRRSRRTASSIASRAASTSCCRSRRSTRTRRSIGFVAEGEDKPPHFHYRPLTVDPDEAKRELYAIDFRALEDPLLEQLLGEKRHELDAQLTMLATRNTPAFQSASMFLYGAVSPRRAGRCKRDPGRRRQPPAARRKRRCRRNRGGGRGAGRPLTAQSTRPSRPTSRSATTSPA